MLQFPFSSFLLLYFNYLLSTLLLNKLLQKMAFFQTDLDPLHLREQHNNKEGTAPRKHIKQQLSLQQQQQQVASFTTTKFFHHFFKGSVINESRSRITSDPMNRLVSFHL